MPDDPTISAKAGNRITVLNPMGFPPKVTAKQPAPRLSSLDGKTVYLVDCRFDDSIELLKQVQAWFADKMPSVKTRMVSLNSVYRHDDPKTWDIIKANGDAAIFGVGHCSTCAPAVTTHTITLDTKWGVPSVAIHTDKFVKVVESVARVGGLANSPKAFVPQPVMGKSAEELRAYVYGNDLATGRPLMQVVVEGLTRAVAPSQSADLSATPRIAATDTEDNLHKLFLENRWTDFLPIVLPTEERVAAMLKGTSRKPDEIVGTLEPTHNRGPWSFTVEKVAVNAVMAGAKPEYLPVILALASSHVSARGSTSSSASPLVVVNGPIRHEIGMNAGTGAMGPYNHANAAIGRAYGLISQNGQGGSVVGETFMGSLGNGYTYSNLTFAENEERSPWEPLHVQRGFKPEQSVVNVFIGMRHMAFTLGLRHAHWQDHLRNLMRGMDPNESPTFLLDPIAARLFQDVGGLKTKKDLIKWISENGRMPAGEYWDYQLIQNYQYPRATFGEEPLASKLKARPDEMIPMWTPEQVNVVVVGGETNGYWRIAGARLAASACVDDWR